MELLNFANSILTPMQIDQIVSHVKSLLLEGKVADALTTLYSFLEKEGKYSELANTTLQLKTKLAQLQQKQARDIISFEKSQLLNSQIVNNTTDLLSKLKKGDFTTKTLGSKTSSSRKWWVSIIVILALVAGFFGYKNLTKKQKITKVTSVCPPFDNQSEFNILILPFTNFGAKSANFDIAIKQRFERFKSKLSFPLDTEIYMPLKNQKVNPTNGEEAEKFANKCTEKVKLLLWGSYEKKANKTIVTTQYKFLNIGKQFSYGLINVSGDLNPVTVESVSSIATAGSATGDIEALLLGIAANQMGDDQAAIDILAPLIPRDSASSLLWGMTLADSYHSNGFEKKAIESYDKVLKQHPDYRFALLNRSQLNFQDGKTDMAIKDLNHQLKKFPNDKEAKYARAAIYVQSNQLGKAKTDISALEKNNAPKKIMPLKKKYKQKVAKENKRKRNAKAKLATQPNNIQALNVLSEASFRLGDYTTALKATEKTIARDPKNQKAWTIQVRAMKELKTDPKEMQNTFKKANAAGISTQELKSASFYNFDKNN